MSALTEDLADLAVELITEEGRVITIRSKVNVPDPAQPWKLLSTSNTDQVTVGAFFENMYSDLVIALGQVLGAPEGARSNLNMKETSCLIPARDLTSEIVAENTIIDGTSTWEIISVEKIGPGTVPVLYICTLGR